MTAYTTVHNRLRKQFGPAKNQLCSCGRQAHDWAYLRNDANEVTDPRSGAVYSMSPSPEFYQPRCRNCHAAIDRDLRAAGYARRTEAFLADAERVEKQREIGKASGAIRAEKVRTDPVYRAELADHMRRLNASVNKTRITCAECGMVSTKSGLLRHQRASGHQQTSGHLEGNL